MWLLNTEEILQSLAIHLRKKFLILNCIIYFLRYLPKFLLTARTFFTALKWEWIFYKRNYSLENLGNQVRTHGRLFSVRIALEASRPQRTAPMGRALHRTCAAAASRFPLHVCSSLPAPPHLSLSARGCNCNTYSCRLLTPYAVPLDVDAAVFLPGSVALANPRSTVVFQSSWYCGICSCPILWLPLVFTSSVLASEFRHYDAAGGGASLRPTSTSSHLHCWCRWTPSSPSLQGSEYHSAWHCSFTLDFLFALNLVLKLLTCNSSSLEWDVAVCTVFHHAEGGLGHLSMLLPCGSPGWHLAYSAKVVVFDSTPCHSCIWKESSRVVALGFHLKCLVALSLPIIAWVYFWDMFTVVRVYFFLSLSLRLHFEMGWCRWNCMRCSLCPN